MMPSTDSERATQIEDLRAREAAGREEAGRRWAEVARIQGRLDAITQERVALQDAAARLGGELQTHAALAGQLEHEAVQLANQAATLEAQG